MPSLLGTGPGVHCKNPKTVNQSLKHKVNRCVLSLRLNECKLSASRTAAVTYLLGVFQCYLHVEQKFCCVYKRNTSLTRSFAD